MDAKTIIEIMYVRGTRGWVCVNAKDDDARARADDGVWYVSR